MRCNVMSKDGGLNYKCLFANITIKRKLKIAVDPHSGHGLKYPTMILKCINSVYLSPQQNVTSQTNKHIKQSK